MRVSLIDVMGVQHQIETFSPGLLRTWLGEWLPLVVPADPALKGGARISVWPSFGPGGQPDWVCDSRVIGGHHPIETQDADEAMLYIRNLRQDLEARIARLEAERAAHR